MLEIEETKNVSTNVGNNIFVGLREGGIIELSHSSPEGMKTREPFARFKIKRKPRLVIKYKIDNFIEGMNENRN